MEVIHSIKITVEIDTNKDTYRHTFETFEELIEWLAEHDYLDTESMECLRCAKS